MPGDPYAALARCFSGGNSAPIWVLADVLRTSPLQVEYGGVPLEGEDLVVNTALLIDDPEFKALRLKPGDTVALLPDNAGERFLVLAKVVLQDE